MRIEHYLHVLQKLDVNKRKTIITLSQELSTSTNTLERIMKKLKKFHLIHTQTGQGGGYVLTKPYKLMRVSDIIPLIDKRDRLCQSLAYRLRFHSLSVLIDPID